MHKSAVIYLTSLSFYNVTEYRVFSNTLLFFSLIDEAKA